MGMGGAGKGGNVYQQAAQNLGAGTAATGASAALATGAAAPAASGMGMYANPYTNQVINRTMGDINRQAAQQQTMNEANAINAGAFGGSRHGVTSALTNEAAQRQLADTAANLRYQGFNTAANLANQDLNRQLGAAGALQGAAGMYGNIAGQQFGMGQDVARQQWQQGALTQGMNQMLLDQAQGMFNQYINQPVNMLALRNQAVGSSPLANAGTTSQQYTPGLLDYLGLGLQAYGM